MKTFKVVIRESNFYVREVEADSWLEANDKANKYLWHNNYPDWGISYNEECVYEIKETKETA